MTINNHRMGCFILKKITFCHTTWIDSRKTVNILIMIYFLTLFIYSLCLYIDHTCTRDVNHVQSYCSVPDSRIFNVWRQWSRCELFVYDCLWKRIRCWQDLHHQIYIYILLTLLPHTVLFLVWHCIKCESSIFLILISTLYWKWRLPRD